jgi:DNA-directed RNA polymerase specialized sigma24 family protein
MSIVTGIVQEFQFGMKLVELLGVRRQHLRRLAGHGGLPRCGSAVLAEELTAETFMAAVAAVAWLVGVARHKLVDHWRRIDRERRGLGGIVSAAELVDDLWEAQLPVAEVAGSSAGAFMPPRRSWSGPGRRFAASTRKGKVVT